MFFLKKKKFVSVDKRIKMKLRKYFKVGLLHMNDHPHTRKLFVTTKNDRTMKKKSYSSDDVSLAEKLSNAKRKRSLT